MDELFYRAALFVLLMVFLAVREPGLKKLKKREQKVSESTKTDLVMLFLSTLGMMVFPVVYCFSSLFDGFSAGFPVFLRLFGIILYAASIILMYLVLGELKGDWSMKLELWDGHRLVTSGPYRHIRHPMYTAFYMMTAGQLFLTSNWFVGLFGVISFTILCFVRIPKEEEMMEAEFADEYPEYKKRTARIIPFIF